MRNHNRGCPAQRGLATFFHSGILSLSLGIEVTMTPSRAIKIECTICRRGAGPCTSQHCALNDSGKSLERIKEHCLNCAPDNQPAECSGEITGTQAEALHAMYGINLRDGKAECPLYPFREGKNPKMGRKGSAGHLKAFQYTPQSAVFEGKFERKELCQYQDPCEQ